MTSSLSPDSLSTWVGPPPLPWSTTSGGEEEEEGTAAAVAKGAGTSCSSPGSASGNIPANFARALRGGGRGDRGTVLAPVGLPGADSGSGGMAPPPGFPPGSSGVVVLYYVCANCGGRSGVPFVGPPLLPEAFLPAAPSSTCSMLGFDGLPTPPTSPTEPAFLGQHHPVLLCAPVPSSSSSPSPSPPRRGPGRAARECKFCRNNGEAETTYNSHTLRCPLTQRLICPVLRSHVCEICSATGDDAHTRNYCPKLSREEKMLRALPTQLHGTRRQASGVRGATAAGSGSGSGSGFGSGSGAFGAAPEHHRR